MTDFVVDSGIPDDAIERIVLVDGDARTYLLVRSPRPMQLTYDDRTWVWTGGSHALGGDPWRYTYVPVGGDVGQAFSG